MDHCSRPTYELVAAHCEEIAWKYSALSEVMLRNPLLWLGSNVSPGVTVPATTLPNEPTLGVNWDLPLNEYGQRILFGRIFNDYQFEAGMLEAPHRRQYRKTAADLLMLRKVAAFWSQVCDFIHSQMSTELFAKFEQDVVSTSRRDDELLTVIDLQPSSFAVSQMKSMRELAIKSKQSEDSLMASSMAQQYAELRAQQFKYFETGLAADWRLIDQVRGAMATLETATHIKKIRWLAALARNAEDGVAAHMQKYCRIDSARNIDDAMKAVCAYSKTIRHEDATQDLLVLGVVDFNQPDSTRGDMVQTLSAFVSRLNGVNAEKTCVIVVTPERAKECSKRGLTDEEGSIEKELWLKMQYCDKRWIFPFNLPRAARNHSNMRRWMTGRLAVDNEAKTSNEWILSSELSLAGRPLADGFEIGELPLQRDLVLMESINPNEDLRTAERQRPGEEQVQGQKGIKISETLIRSALTDVQNIEARSVLVVNLSGYVEDTGIAMVNLRSAGFPKVRYISFNLDDEKCYAFGKARLANHLSDLWMKKGIELPGVQYDDTPPTLSQDELAAIPGGLVAHGELDKLLLACCARSGAAILIKDDAKKEWTSSDDAFNDKFAELQALHNKHYANALTTILAPTGAHATDPPPLAIEDGVVGLQPTGVIQMMESLDALKAAKTGHAVKIGPSEYTDVQQIHVGEDEVWLLSANEDKIVPAKTVIGSFGGGSYVNAAPAVVGVAYNFDRLGDRTIVHFEGFDGSASGVMTFYAMLRAVEDKGTVYNRWSLGSLPNGVHASKSKSPKVHLHVPSPPTLQILLGYPPLPPPGFVPTGVWG